jgi:hypothetical protein
MTISMDYRHKIRNIRNLKLEPRLTLIRYTSSWYFQVFVAHIHVIIFIFYQLWPVMLSYFSTCLNMRWMLLFFGWHKWLFNPVPAANI